MSSVPCRLAGRNARLARLAVPLLAGVALVALWPAQGRAQGAAPVVAGGARTDLRANLEGIYDSNVSRSNSSLAAARGLTGQDYILEPSVSFDVARPLSRQSVFLTGSVGYDFYARNRIFNRERIDATAGTALQAGGCHATLTAGYARHQSELQDLEILGVLQNVETVQTYRLAADCARPIGFSPTGSVSETTTDNSLDLQKNANHRTLSGSAGLLYSNPILGRVQLFAEYDTTEYPNRFLVFDGAGRSDGYKAYSGGISYERHVGSRLDATVQASYMRLRPDVPNEPGFDGLTYKADAALRISSRLQATLDLEQGAIPANRIGVSFARNQTVQAALNYQVSPRLTLSAGGFVRDRRYEGANLDPALFVMHERVNGLFGSSELKLGRKLSLLMDCRWEQQTADIAAFSYDDVRVGLTVSAKF